jgi:hypothetical protein
MSGSLIKIDEEIVTSAVASVTLGGSDWDSSYDVYMVKFSNVTPTTDATIINARILKSDNTADSTANYDRAFKILRTDTTFSNSYSTNQTEFGVEQLGTGTGESANGIMYLFNFNNASEYNFCTFEYSNFDSSPRLIGGQGGFLHTVAQLGKGLQFFMSSSTIAGGTFTLYGLKK